jgi:hypothetical protein
VSIPPDILKELKKPLGKLILDSDITEKKIRKEIDGPNHKIISQMRRVDRSGSPHSTKLSPSIHVPLSPHISDLVTTTIPGSSRRLGSTYAISTE